MARFFCSLCGFKIGKRLDRYALVYPDDLWYDIGKNAVVGEYTLVNINIPDGATVVVVLCRMIERGE